MLKKTTVLAAIAALAACTPSNGVREDRNRYLMSGIAPPGEATAIGGGPRATTVELATDDVAAARCAREDRCGNIGADKRFGNPRECLETVAREVVDELDSTHCPDGIAVSALSSCTTETRNDSCGSEADHCRAAKVCVRSDANSGE
jgi:hypothetical protein